MPAHITPASSGGSLTVSAQTASFSAGSGTNNTLYSITPSGDTAVGTLPAASAVSTGFTILFKNNTDGKDVTIARAGSDTIDGLTSYRVPGRSVVAVTRVSSSAWIVTQTPEAPVGAIKNYGGATAPLGWMLPTSLLASKTTYSGLYAIYGTSFGAGDVSNFALPDLNRTIGGLTQGNDVFDIGDSNPGGFSSSDVGATGGEAAHALTNSESAELQLLDAAEGVEVTPVLGYSGVPGAAHNTIHPTILLNRIIKT